MAGLQLHMMLAQSDHAVLASCLACKQTDNMNGVLDARSNSLHFVQFQTYILLLRVNFCKDKEILSAFVGLYAARSVSASSVLPHWQRQPQATQLAKKHPDSRW